MQKLSNAKNPPSFDSNINCLMTRLSCHCLWDKGPFAANKKASCPGYGTRRPLKIIVLNVKKNKSVIAAIHRIVLCFYDHYRTI